MGFWETPCKDRYYYYFFMDEEKEMEDKTWEMMIAKNKGRDDNFYYCVTGYIGSGSRSFEIAASAVENIKDAKKIAEEWFYHQYTNYINDLKRSLSIAEKRKEELERVFIK